MDKCPCGSGNGYDVCCEPFLKGAALPPTAEQLMRSRYSAYTRQDIAYLRSTLWPALQASFDAPATARWAAESFWTGLTVLETEAGGKTDRKGTVLFEAKFLNSGALKTHRELSLFRKKSGRWYYVEALPEN